MKGARVLVGTIIPVLLLGAACGGKGGGGTHTDPNTPVINNLAVSFRGRCTLASGTPGTIEVLTFEFIDADGNVRGGILENRTTAVAGGTLTFTTAIPDSGVTIAGTTSGTISVTGCLVFGSNPSVTEEVQVIDSSGKRSNVLKLEVARPGGAPLLPQDGDRELRKSL
jgi:hypothetical protein